MVAEQDRSRAESDRLLYVAATRAQDRLLFSGCVSIRKDGAFGSLGGWLGKVAPAFGLSEVHLDYDNEGSRALDVPLPVTTVPASCTIYEPLAAWEPAGATPASRVDHDVILPPPLLGALTHLPEEVDRRTREKERDPPRRIWRVVPPIDRPRAPAWVIGSLVHDALAAWRFQDGAFDRWAQARARELGVTDLRQLGDCARQAGRLLDRFRRHPLAEEMSQAQRRMHEVPYDLESDGRYERGVIDAMFFAHGEWTVVEFKTDRVRDEAQLAQLLDTEDYVPQVLRYGAAVEQLVGARPRLLLCMLNFAGRIRVEEL
jgi:ATP-dependent exoDNAse (exonuclease V) beta subunit